MQKETAFKLKVVARLKLLDDIWVAKIQQVVIRGTPDLLICYKGHFVAWELKVGHNVASPLQQHQLDGIIKAKGIARVVTPENLDESIQELLCLK